MWDISMAQPYITFSHISLARALSPLTSLVMCLADDLMS